MFILYTIKTEAFRRFDEIFDERDSFGSHSVIDSCIVGFINKVPDVSSPYSAGNNN